MQRRPFSIRYAGITLLDQNHKCLRRWELRAFSTLSNRSSKNSLLKMPLLCNGTALFASNGRFVPDDQIGVRNKWWCGQWYSEDRSTNTLQVMWSCPCLRLRSETAKSFGGKSLARLGLIRSHRVLPVARSGTQGLLSHEAAVWSNSWYWTVWHIDQMYQETKISLARVFKTIGKSLEKLNGLLKTKQEIIKYATLKGNEEAAEAAESEVTNEA